MIPLSAGGPPRRLLLTYLLGIAVPACVPPPQEPAAEQPLVVATILPVANLTAALAKDDARVEVLLPPRASPATWEATPSQVRALSEAAAYIRVGAGLDAWTESYAPAAQVSRVLVLTEGMKLAGAPAGGHGHEGAGNPHVWLDPVLVRDAIVPLLVDLLIGVAPAAGDSIRARAARVSDTLTALDAELRSLLSSATRPFVATHDAWAYFADRYGLEAAGSVYGSPGREPSPRDLARLASAVRRSGVGVVFVEPQLAKGAAITLAAEIGAATVVVDPLGATSVDGLRGYTALMRTNARRFADALGGAR